MHTFKIGQSVWRGFRYWKMDSLVGTERVGWNTKFIAYQIQEITPQRIKVCHDAFTIAGTEKSAKDWKPLFLNRATMEKAGKQYHTRYHEYFYATKPKSDPEHRYYSSPSFHAVFGTTPSHKALDVLGLSHPYTETDAKRAYRRLAKSAHPDKGGTSQEFTRLKSAYDTALRFATVNV